VSAECPRALEEKTTIVGSPVHRPSHGSRADAGPPVYQQGSSLASSQERVDPPDRPHTSGVMVPSGADVLGLTPGMLGHPRTRHGGGWQGVGPPRVDPRPSAPGCSTAAADRPHVSGVMVPNGADVLGPVPGMSDHPRTGHGGGWQGVGPPRVDLRPTAPDCSKTAAKLVGNGYPVLHAVRIPGHTEVLGPPRARNGGGRQGMGPPRVGPCPITPRRSEPPARRDDHGRPVLCTVQNPGHTDVAGAGQGQPGMSQVSRTHSGKERRVGPPRADPQPSAPGHLQDSRARDGDENKGVGPPRVEPRLWMPSGKPVAVGPAGPSQLDQNAMEPPGRTVVSRADQVKAGCP
jgi:hypothetical protein